MTKGPQAFRTISEAADEAPGTELFLDPDWQFVPNAAYAETFGIVARRNLEHGERADLRAMFGLFDEAVLYA